jgi:hypothetical protein
MQSNQLLKIKSIQIIKNKIALYNFYIMSYKKTPPTYKIGYPHTSKLR